MLVYENNTINVLMDRYNFIKVQFYYSSYLVFYLAIV